MGGESHTWVDFGILHFRMRWSWSHPTQTDRLDPRCLCETQYVPHVTGTTDIVKYDSYRVFVVVTLICSPVAAIAVNIYQPALLVSIMFPLQE